MPRASVICAAPGCSRLKSECREHRKAPWQGSTRRKRLPRGWERLRRKILKRDPLCTQCRRAPSTEVHHLRGSENHRETALAGVCADCHSSLTGRQGQAARNALR